MATDMFGNILSPEDEERLRRHAEAMGMLPPALRVQMTAPFGGGIGPQSYQGSFAIPPSVPDSLPLFSQNITPVPTDVTVDPTMAGMAGVTQDYGPFSPSLGALSGMLAPAPSSSLPSYFDDPVVNEEMERVVAEEAATKVDDFAMLASQDPVASLGGWIKDVTKTVELPDIVEKKQRYTSPMPVVPMEDVVPQTGITPVGFTTGADVSVPEVTVAPSMQGVDYSKALADVGIDPATAGMAEVSGAELDFERFRPGEDKGMVDPTWPDTGGLGTTTTVDLIDLLAGSNTFGIPTLPELQDKVMDLTGNKSYLDLPGWLVGPLFSGLKDERKARQEREEEVAAQVDTFKDIPAAPAKPAGPTPAEIAAANAASRASTRAAQKAAAAAQRKADLAEQKAAARRTQLARQALKDSQAAATRAAAASAADKLAKEKAAKAVLARLSQDRNTPSAREVAKAREVLSQIDTFGTGGQRGFMGAEVGIEDGGGYTGGDFSSGAGWE